MLPLEGLTVVDFSQFLAGPAASLRLADLGAKVVKIERPDGGDLCRQLYISNLELDGDSTLFHSINRNKMSFSANLKDPADLEQVRELVAKADVVIQNFRPGVIERLGLDYAAVRKLNPRIVYGTVTGYGNAGPWRDKPGQDLLAQSLSGVAWLSGDGNGPPVPMGLAVADMFAGAFLVQGILACLVRRGMTGEGGLVEISLLEALLDFQFEVLTTHLNDGGQLPQRAKVNNAHAYLGAPYGIYATADGYLAIAMTPLQKLSTLLQMPELATFDRAATFALRDEIKGLIATRLKTQNTKYWLDILEPADVWCAQVLDWPTLLQHEAFKVLEMTQRTQRSSGSAMTTLRCPLRIDGQVLKSPVGSPKIGEHNGVLREMLGTRK
jgi:CoA:oxalate CoA-transferase